VARLALEDIRTKLLADDTKLLADDNESSRHQPGWLKHPGILYQ